MKVNVMLKDMSVRAYTDVKMVCNASTTLVNDWIYIYKNSDIHGQPSIRLRVSEVICVEAIEEWYEPVR